MLQHFTWNVLANKTSTGGMSSFYAKRSRALFAATDRQARSTEVDGFVRELSSRRPSAAECDEAFKRLWYTEERPAEKRLVQYILTRIYKNERPDSGQDFGRMTIEHLMSQSTKSGHIGRLGNLVLVSGALNARLTNKNWEQKQKILKLVEDEWIPGDVKNSDTWSNTDIDERTEQMAKQCLEIWSR